MTEIETSIVSFIDQMRDKASAQTLPLTSDTQLLELGVIDSMGLVKLVQFVEERFGIAIPDDKMTPELFSSAAVLAQFVAQLV